MTRPNLCNEFTSPVGFNDIWCHRPLFHQGGHEGTVTTLEGQQKYAWLRHGRDIRDPLDRTEHMTGKDFLLSQVAPPPVTGLYLTKLELVELYLTLNGTHDASPEILSKVSDALKGAL